MSIWNEFVKNVSHPNTIPIVFIIAGITVTIIITIIAGLQGLIAIAWGVLGGAAVLAVFTAIVAVVVFIYTLIRRLF